MSTLAHIRDRGYVDRWWNNRVVTAESFYLTAQEHANVDCWNVIMGLRALAAEKWGRPYSEPETET